MRKILIVTCLLVLLFGVGCTSLNISSYMSQLHDDTEKEDSMWSIGHYVDDFGNSTDRPYLYFSEVYAPGIFSNSATNASPMWAQFFIEEDNIGIELYEYNLKMPVTLLSFENAYLKIQTEDRETINLGRCEIYNNGRRLVLKSSKVQKLFEALATGKIIQFRMEVSSQYGTPSIYNFFVGTAGFIRAYQEAFLGITY